jgi:hypothetical protein
VNLVLKQYIREVLTGFRSLSSTGPDRALGNIRQGDSTSGHQNRGIFADLEDLNGWEFEEDHLVKDEGNRIP